MGLGQSWTDPFSNHTYITNVEISSRLDDLLGIGTTPEDLLLPLMHEASHHWCFLSPVGNAVSAINFRMRQHAIALMDKKAYPEEPLLQCFVASLVVTEMLRPISEGIALAMEFDAINRKSPFISTPFVAAARAFAPGDPQDRQFIAMPTNAALTRARKGPEGVDRRLNVYADRLDRDGTGYLLGYMSARSMMRSLWRGSSRLVEEGDLCISYLRTYIYGDWELVDLMLDAEHDELRLANDIREYISNRLWDVQDVTASQIDLFEALAAGDRPSTDPAYAIALRYDPDKAARGQRRIMELVRELAEPPELANPKLSETQIGLTLLDSEVAQARSMVYLGGDQVEVDVKQAECMVRFQGRTLLEAVPTAAEDGVSRGSIDVFYDSQTPDGRRYVHITSDQHGHVAFVVAGPNPADAPPADFSPQLSTSQARELTALYDAIVDRAIAESPAAVAVKHLRDALPDVCQGLYVDVATRFVRLDRRDDILAQLGTGGLRAVLRSDRDLAEAQAIAAATTPVAPSRTAVKAAFTQEGLPIDLIEQLLDISGDGLELALGEGDLLVMLV